MMTSYEYENNRKKSSSHYCLKIFLVLILLINIGYITNTSIILYNNIIYHNQQQNTTTNINNYKNITSDIRQIEYSINNTNYIDYIEDTYLDIYIGQQIFVSRCCMIKFIGFFTINLQYLFDMNHCVENFFFMICLVANFLTFIICSCIYIHICCKSHNRRNYINIDLSYKYRSSKKQTYFRCCYNKKTYCSKCDHDHKFGIKCNELITNKYAACGNCKHTAHENVCIATDKCSSCNHYHNNSTCGEILKSTGGETTQIPHQIPVYKTRQIMKNVKKVRMVMKKVPETVSRIVNEKKTRINKKSRYVQKYRYETQQESYIDTVSTWNYSTGQAITNYVTRYRPINVHVPYQELEYYDEPEDYNVSHTEYYQTEIMKEVPEEYDATELVTENTNEIDHYETKYTSITAPIVKHTCLCTKQLSICNCKHNSVIRCQCKN